MSNHSEMNSLSASHELEADVLVIGGGPAGTWAAVSAASSGARVVLADKGYCGSSGATAPSGTGVWYVPPDPARRLAAMESREKMGGYLQDRHWMSRVLDRTYESVNLLAERGYPFPIDDQGQSRRTSLQGPEYMRLMRRMVKQAGVTIMDHSPALELLVDEDGAVGGAAGVRRQKGDTWLVRANAVVIATGGCAFLSKALGCNVLTGDGYLMAAEAGADLSGMEFSNAYAISPAFASVTKTLFYKWATFTYEDGSEIPGAQSQGGRSVIARTLLKGPVYAKIDKADGITQTAMRHAQPNFFVPFDRAGIDPFNQRFKVTLRLEGTVRGTGGLRIVNDSCATSVPGLYAAGDAASRELVCGGFTGGGSHNAAWAMSSGFWAGAGAAESRRRTGFAASGLLRRSGSVALAKGPQREIDAERLTTAVQAEVVPFERNYFRTGDVLAGSLNRLNTLWADARNAGPSSLDVVVKAREAAAMLATGRWMYTSALARTETRGMHKRYDYLQQDEDHRGYLTVGELDEPWTSLRPAPDLPMREAAA